MEFSFILTFFCCLWVSAEGTHQKANLREEPQLQQSEEEPPKSPLDLITAQGYRGEEHKVNTADGYILTLHRVLPQGKGKPKGTFLFQHGLLSSSVDFLILGKDSLAFVLASAGYDVWLGNVRGNSYSQFHKRLSTMSGEFWNFSWHESALYDLPAEIDFILKYTKKKELAYLGFSFGATLLFALTSTKLEYNKKIKFAVVMAPLVFVKNVKSPLLLAINSMPDPLYEAFESVASGKFAHKAGKNSYLTKFMCDLVSFNRSSCYNHIFQVTGVDSVIFDQDVIREYSKYFPNQYSVRGIRHFCQLMDSNLFRQFDFGRKVNRQRYKSSRPPQYPLEKVSVPTFFYLTEDDTMARNEDVQRLLKKLPQRTVRKVWKTNVLRFSISFILSQKARAVVYEKIVEDFQRVYSFNF